MDFFEQYNFLMLLVQVILTATIILQTEVDPELLEDTINSPLQIPA